MGDILMDRVGNVFIAKSDDNLGGTSASIISRDRIGQNFLAFDGGAPGLPNTFLHYSDYINDEIGIAKKSGVAGDVITTYSFPNDNYVDTKPTPLPVPDISESIAYFFVNGSLFIKRDAGGNQDFTIKKYSWPELVEQATLNITSDSAQLKVVVSDTKIFVAFRDSGINNWRFRRYDDSFNLEASGTGGGQGGEPAIAADAGFFYFSEFAQWTPPFPSFYRMFRMTTSFGSQTTLFNYTGHGSDEVMAADNSLIYVQLTGLDWRIYNHAGTIVGTLAASNSTSRYMSTIGLTDNYVATLTTGAGGSVKIYNNTAPFALVRTLS